MRKTASGHDSNFSLRCNTISPFFRLNFHKGANAPKKNKKPAPTNRDGLSLSVSSLTILRTRSRSQDKSDTLRQDASE